MNTYAAYCNNEIRRESSSGGLFSLIASQFDVIYGVVMTQDYYGAEYIRTETDVSRLRGSKYLQAKMGDIFKMVKKDLQNGKKVLFTGTGCQINGLYMYLKNIYPTLFLMDVVCHGVPSQMVWKKYVEYQENQFGKLEFVNFRDKTNGWTDFRIKENNRFCVFYENVYMKMFLRNYCLRPSCYACHAKYYKMADMTIGDFWGIEEIAPEMYDNMGTSLVIARTEKGQALFEGIKDKLVYKSVTYEDGVKNNSAEFQSVERPKMRDSFYKDLERKSFEEMVKKYASEKKISLWRKVVRKVKRFIMEMLRSNKK